MNKATMFNDLLFYNISKREWTCVKIPGGPAPRSGHQMIAVPGGKGGQLWVFGGEYSSSSQSQFYHYKDLWWRKLEPTGTAPAPRSACQMAATPNGKVLISGGYSRQRIKKDVDKGIAHTDSFLLTPDKGDESGTKWKWVSVKTGGISPYPRSGVAFTTAPGGRALAFGGVCDEEVSLSGKKDAASKTRRRRRKDGDEGEASEEEEETMEQEEPMKVGPSLGTVQTGSSSVAAGNAAAAPVAFVPSTRMNAGLAVKQGKLYLYGGLYEDGDRQITLSDMYCLDLHKMDEWHTLLDPEQTEEWIESSSGSEGEEEGSDSSEEEEDEESPMETG
ncbi:hypothetical protein B566_EDAN004124 [Ephemera danica]|nr:hypothetical protein B566_EDAN004124 [Ephemera danica]